MNQVTLVRVQVKVVRDLDRVQIQEIDIVVVDQVQIAQDQVTNDDQEVHVIDPEDVQDHQVHQAVQKDIIDRDDLDHNQFKKQQNTILMSCIYFMLKIDLT